MEALPDKPKQPTCLRPANEVFPLSPEVSYFVNKFYTREAGYLDRLQKLQESLRQLAPDSPFRNRAERFHRATSESIDRLENFEITNLFGQLPNTDDLRLALTAGFHECNRFWDEQLNRYQSSGKTPDVITNNHLARRLKIGHETATLLENARL